MEKYTQDKTLLSIDTPLGKDALLLIEILGHETLSLGFEFKLLAMTQPGMTDIDIDALKGNLVSFSVQPPNQPARHFNGICIESNSLDNVSKEQHLYSLRIVPWFETMANSSDCRVFQNKSAVDIFTELCQEHGFRDFDISALKSKHRSIPFCVQYNESYHVFLNRILAREGISYYFRFEKNRHVMVLIDQRSKKQSLAETIPWNPKSTERKPHLREWVAGNGQSSGQYSARGSDFYNAATQKPIDTSITNLSASTKNGAQKKEDFSYPGRFDNVSDGQQYVYRNMLVEQALKTHNKGNSTVLAFTPYTAFKVAEPTPDLIGKTKYYIVEVEHHARDYTTVYRQDLVRQASGRDHVEPRYENFFKSLPFTLDYSPEQKIKTPQIYSSQTAIVQGNKKGEPYVDKFGRIKVKFIWDRSSNTTSASFWLRVAMNVAGRGWGHQFLPRAGSEVWVEFVNGDPDFPIVTGNADNAEHMPVYDIKTEKNKSGIRSRTVGSDDINDGNELQFDDTPGAEKLRLASSNDIMINVEGDESHRVKNNHLEKVAGISNRYIYGSATYVAKKSLTLQAELGSITILPDTIQIKGIRVSFDESNTVDSMPTFPASEKPTQMKATAPAAPIESTTTAGATPAPQAPAAMTTPVPTDNVDTTADAEEIVELIYATGSKTFYGLTAADVKDFEASEKELFDPINAVVQANKDTSDQKDEKVTQAKKDLNKKIKALVNGPGSSKITEVVRFKSKKYTYIDSTKMRNHWRGYKMDNDIKARSIMTPDKKRIDIEKLKDKLSRSAKVVFYSKGCSGSIGEWADHLNKYGDLQQTLIGDRKNPNGIFLAKADEQLLRYTAGVSVSGGYNPKEASVSLNLNGKAELALAEARVSANAYIPDQNGFELKIVRGKNPDGEQKTVQQPDQISLGFLRVQFDFGLNFFAGASVMASVSLNCDLKPGKNKKGDDVSQLKVNGTNIKHNRKGDKVVAGGNAFAGVEAGCDVGATFAWLNPEKHQEQWSNDQSWSVFASVRAEGDAALGVGLEGDFEIKYDIQTSKFVIRAKVGVVCGFGVSGSIGVVVYANHILSFVQYIYHKIMNQNFEYIGFIAVDAFKRLELLLIKLILNAESTLEADIVHVAEKEMQELETWWNNIVGELFDNDKSLTLLENYADKINKNSDRLKFALPEVKGRLLYMFTDPSIMQRVRLQSMQIDSSNVGDLPGESPFPNSIADNMLTETEMQRIQSAIVNVLRWIQTKAEYINVLQHMSIDGVKVSQSIEESEHQLYTALGEYGRNKIKENPQIKELIDKCRQRVIFPDEPRMNQPVQPNTEIPTHV